MAVGLGECSEEELGEAIDQLHAVEVAARAQLMRVVSEFDRRQAWTADGCGSMDAWLVARLGVSFGTARQVVDVARRLKRLPALAAVAAEGKLSWDQLRFASELARPDTDELMAESAPAMTVAALARAARFAKPPKPDPGTGRGVTVRPNEAEGWGRIVAELPLDEFDTVVRALSRIAEGAPRDPETGLFEPFAARCADALVELASARLAGDGDADRATTVVHVDLGVLAGGDGLAELEAGAALAAETARRLACDSHIQWVLDDHRGCALGVGRRSRRVPAWMMRLIRFRDRHCRFPGCRRTRWVHAHHVEFWGRGGPTDLANLVLLCHRHHRLVHEGGWSVTGDPDGEIQFARPDHTPLRSTPPGLRPDVRYRLFEPSP